MGCADQIRKNRPTLTRTRPTIAPDALCSSLRIFSKKYRASCSSVDVFDSHHQRTVCRDTPSGRPPGLLGHWTSRLQDYVSTSYLYSHLRAKCCQISVEYRSGRQDLNLRTLLPHRDRTMDADDVFDRFPAHSRLTGAADMILVPIKKTRATTLHIRGRDIADENGLGHQ